MFENYVMSRVLVVEASYDEVSSENHLLTGLNLT